MIPRLHLLTDTRLQQQHSHLQLALMAAEAGADAVQYREKDKTAEQQATEVAEMVAELQEYNTLLIVNDHPQVALQAAAHGVHVGRQDDAPQRALALLPGRLVGATVHSPQELDDLAGLPISYIGVGPVFGTQSKDTGLPPLGIEGLKQICNLSPYPVIAIGSITAENLPQVMDAGAYGVAVLSAFCLAPDPQAATRTLLRALRPYRT